MRSGGLIVTGATGYLGSHFLLRVSRSQAQPVVAIARSTAQFSAAERVTQALRAARACLGDADTNPGAFAVVEGDVRSERCGIDAEHAAALRRADIEECWHFAADLRYEAAHRAAIWQSNVEGTRHAVALAQAIGVRRFVYVSTAYVAGTATGTIAEALHDCNGPFNNAYEESKCAAEQLVRSECRARGLAFTIVRPSVVIGPRSTKRAGGTESGLYGMMRAVVALQPFVERAAAPIRVAASADVQINFIPVDDLTSDLLALRADGFGVHDVYHLTAATGVSVAACFDAIGAVTGIGNVIFLQPGSFEPNALERRVARRIEFYLGYLCGSKIFEHRLASRWTVDRSELIAYIRAAAEALASAPGEAGLAAVAGERRG